MRELSYKTKTRKTKLPKAADLKRYFYLVPLKLKKPQASSCVLLLSPIKAYPTLSYRSSTAPHKEKKARNNPTFLFPHFFKYVQYFFQENFCSRHSQSLVVRPEIIIINV